MSYQKQRATGLRPTQPYEQNVKTGPVNHQRTTRFDDLSVVTSTLAGKFLPVAMVPLLREDRALNSTITLNFQMAETADMLLKPVRASASAWLVPKMAFDRFSGYDSINRSYNSQPEIDDSIIPWFNKVAFDDGTTIAELYQKMGLHAPLTSNVNSDYVEAYNAVWNHIATNMSKDIALRTSFDDTIAPAFWEHTQMKHVKATFDDAMMEGQVPLSIVNSSIMTTPGQFAPTNDTPVTGITRVGAETFTGDASAGGDANQIVVGLDGNNLQVALGSTGDGIWSQGGLANMDGIMSELQQDGIVVSLANIDLARETAAWARLRTQYQGLSEDWMMDQLLSGIAIPEEGMKHPILLDRQSVPFGMQQRYATDGASLDQSSTNGQTGLQLRVRTPAINTGGVIVIAAQILPEMVYERQKDYYLTAPDVAALPDRTADELDPQPVVEVYNNEVDELHALPTDVFGYAPLNHQWIRNKPKIGGRYYRSDPAAPYDEDRNRIWDTTTVDPKLGEDFYLATNIRHDVFKSQNEDPFEVWASGRVPINGLTFFGPSLRESTDDYQKVLDQVDTDRITPPDTTVQDKKPA